jgi:hypothetical protein
MPIRKVPGGYQFGQHGKVYPTAQGAQKQAIAMFANGFQENQQKQAGNKKAAAKQALQNLAKRHSSGKDALGRKLKPGENAAEEAGESAAEERKEPV